MKNQEKKLREINKYAIFALVLFPKYFSTNNVLIT
jgi:hypothetical protein